MTHCHACQRSRDIPSLPEWDTAYVPPHWRPAHAWSALGRVARAGWAGGLQDLLLLGTVR